MDDIDKELAPAHHPGVERAVRRLDAELQRVLGAGADYCLVVAQETPDHVHIQAMTNTTPDRAQQLLACAQSVGFDAIN